MEIEHTYSNGYGDFKLEIDFEWEGSSHSLSRYGSELVKEHHPPEVTHINSIWVTYKDGREKAVNMDKFWDMGIKNKAFYKDIMNACYEKI